MHCQGGDSRQKTLITEFSTVRLHSDKSDLSGYNSENKQRQPQPIRVPHLELLDFRVRRHLNSELQIDKSLWGRG